MGWARIISSVSIANKLRNSIVVGEKRISLSEMVGNAKGSPPASSTPRLIALTKSGIER